MMRGVLTLLLAALLLRSTSARQLGAATPIFATKEQTAIPIKAWQIIGPFVIGKGELDGDPLAAMKGGAAGVAARLAKGKGKGLRFASEYVVGGEIKGWREATADAQGVLQVAFGKTPGVQWTELVQGVGGMELIEWQALVVGRFSLEQPEAVLLRCSGVPAFHVGGAQSSPAAGDAYFGSQQMGQVMQLPAGEHFVRARLRAKHQGRVACSVEVQRNRDPSIALAAAFSPDWVAGDAEPLGGVAALTVHNKGQHQLTDFVVTVEVGGSSGDRTAAIVSASLLEPLSLAPSQHSSLRLQLSATSAGRAFCDTEGDAGNERKVMLLVNGRTAGPVMDGGGAAPERRSVHGRAALTLRCRGGKSSAIMTFLDEDGSVQHAGVVRPPAAAACARSGSGAGCPVLLTLHGTGISASDSADAFKRKVRSSDDDFTFGVEQGYVLAPSRHGAHNWEGVGRLSALAALKALQRTMNSAANGDQTAANVDASRVLVVGHSMGGHGAALLYATIPDVAVGLSMNAGWLRKEQYGDDNTLWMHDSALHAAEPALRSVLESTISENFADALVTNFASPALLRVGEKDRSVHPWYSRRLARLLRARKADYAYSELPGKEHWWWDTEKENDGGVVNDQQQRAHFAKCLEPPASRRGCSQSFTLTAINPASVSAMCGFRVEQQLHTLRTSSVAVSHPLPNHNEPALQWKVATRNVRRLSVALTRSGAAPGDGVGQADALLIDGRLFMGTLLGAEGRRFTADDADGGEAEGRLELCDGGGSGDWARCEPTPWGKEQTKAATHSPYERSPATYGPMRQVFERRFLIVYGSAPHAKESALYLSNLLASTGSAFAPIASDVGAEDAAWDDAKRRGQNLIFLGGARSNRWAKRAWRMSVLAGLPTTMDAAEERVRLGDCEFGGSGVGLAALLPLAEPNSTRLSLLLCGTDSAGLLSAVALATPTIPPMVRQPYSNMLPDFVVVGNETASLGAGGLLAAGFWGADWAVDAQTSYFQHCRKYHASAEVASSQVARSNKAEL